MSQFTFINQTTESPRIAIYKRGLIQNGRPLVAWRIAAPPPGGQETMMLPSAFSVFAKYSPNPDRPDQLTVQTATLNFTETTACFAIQSVAGEHATGATLVQEFDGLVLNQVRVTNQYSQGCEVSVCLDASPVLPPQVVWPGAVLMEDIRGPFYAAVVAPFVRSGNVVIQEEVGLTEVELLSGARLIVTGSMWKGYALSVE